MTKYVQPKNRIKELREERGISSRQLAKMIGTSAPQLSRMENGKSALSIKWILKIAGVLDVPTNEIVDVPFNKKFTTTCDDTLLGSVLGWLMEATDQYKVTLSHQELSKWAGFIYKEAVEQPLNFNETKYLAFTIVKVLKKDRQK